MKDIKVGDQVITKEGLEGEVLWVGVAGGILMAKLEAPNSTKWFEKAEDLETDAERAQGEAEMMKELEPKKK